MITCHNCKAELPDNSKFCGQCGTRLRAQESSTLIESRIQKTIPHIKIEDSLKPQTDNTNQTIENITESPNPDLNNLSTIENIDEINELEAIKKTLLLEEETPTKENRKTNTNSKQENPKPVSNNISSESKESSNIQQPKEKNKKTFKKREKNKKSQKDELFKRTTKFESDKILKHREQTEIQKPKSQNETLKKPKSQNETLKKPKSNSGLLSRPLSQPGLNDDETFLDEDWSLDNEMDFFGSTLSKVSLPAVTPEQIPKSKTKIFVLIIIVLMLIIASTITYFILFNN